MSHDDMLDAFKYATAAAPRQSGKSLTATETLEKMRAAQHQLAKLDRVSMQKWAADMAAFAARPPSFASSVFNAPYKRSQHPHDLMRSALKATKSGYLERWNQMSRGQRDRFIARVKRSPNAVHLRDVYAALVAEAVFNELKD